MYPLRTSAAPWFATGVSIAKAGGTYKLATTQGYQTMETPDGGSRPSVRTASLEEYRKEPNFAREEEVSPALTLYKPYDYKDETYAWGMTIDMNACVGCNNCIVACQSENNIAVVGKEQVASSDATCTGFGWTPTTRVTATIPKIIPAGALQQCENAPCEVVCPVGPPSTAAKA